MKTIKQVRYGLLLLTPLTLIGFAGCSSQSPATTAEEKQAFAPGIDNLSPEAKAAKEKNDRAAQAKSAQPVQIPSPRR